MKLYFAADLEVLPLSVFAVVLAITLGITFTVLSTEKGAERSYDELNVRAQTGFGAEASGEPTPGEDRRPVGTAST